MKTLKSFIITLFVATLVSCGKTVKIDATELKTEIDSVSYAVGISMSKQVEFNFKEVNEEIFIQGFMNQKDSASLLIPLKDVQKILQTYFQKQQNKALEELRAKEKENALKAKENKINGEEFLKNNKSNKDVKTTKSGLQYKILKEGEGEKVKPTDKIKIHYHGTLIDGTVFDSSVERNEPHVSKANEFVNGFKEGLTLMNKGSKYKFFIPQQLAYGESSIPNKILPYSTLIFEVEVLDILN